jgi:hypothetical protein
MRRVISEQDSAVLADLDRLIAKVNDSTVRESAPLLQMARLDMCTRLHGISDGELRDLSAAVERALLSPRGKDRATRLTHPRRRYERATATRLAEKAGARD